MALYLDIPDIFGETYVEKRKQHQLETHDDHWGWIRCLTADLSMAFPDDSSSSGEAEAPTPSRSGGATALSRSGRGGGGTGSEPTVNPINVTKLLDYSSPKLAEAVCTRKAGNKWRVFPTAELHLTNTQDEVIYKMILKKVRIMSYTLNLGEEPDSLSESIVLSYKELKVEYTETSSEFYHDHSAFEWRVTEAGGQS